MRNFWSALAQHSVCIHILAVSKQSLTQALLQFHVLGLPRDSPLRCTHSIFWDTRTNDEGVPREGSFYSLANAGKITMISPARVAKYGDDGRSVVLDDGRTVPASAVILATGYKSTWSPIFDGEFRSHVRLIVMLTIRQQKRR